MFAEKNLLSKAIKQEWKGYFVWSKWVALSATQTELMKGSKLDIDGQIL